MFCSRSSVGMHGPPKKLEVFMKLRSDDEDEILINTLYKQSTKVQAQTISRFGIYILYLIVRVRMGFR